MATLERNLSRTLGPERTRTALGELVMGVRPDPEADLPSALAEFAAGRMDRATFLDRFGHRGSNEMELAQPRWSEDPAALDRLIVGQVSNLPVAEAGWKPAPHWKHIAGEAKLSAAQKTALEQELRTLHAYLGLRETAKNCLMRGYALIRRALLELDQRLKLDGGIFYLTLEELPQLVVQAARLHETHAGEPPALRSMIEERRRRREIALSLDLPSVIFSDDLEAIGRPLAVASQSVLQGVPLSVGVAEGTALVLLEPSQVEGQPEGYILVCPSTDPAWVPLFVNARGLLMETGGVLSHGAIVAREFGLPAVAGLPGIHQQVRTGQRLRVDGSTGTVTILGDNSTSAD